MLKAKTSRFHREDREEALKDMKKDIPKEEMAHFHSLIPISLHQKLKIYVAKKGRGATVKSVLITALNDYLEKVSTE